MFSPNGNHSKKVRARKSMKRAEIRAGLLRPTGLNRLNLEELLWNESE